MIYACSVCGAKSVIVNQCGCDKNNLPPRPANVLEICDLGNGSYATVYQDDTFRYLAITEDETSLGLIQGRVLLAYQSYLFETYARSIVKLSYAWDMPQNIMLMGHGIGGLLRSFKNHYPAAMIRTVEKHMHVLMLAKKYFLGQSLSSEGVYHLEDYIEYLTWPSARNQDIVVVDIFTHETKIRDMTAPEFFHLCDGLLSESGVLIVNLVGEPNDIGNVLGAALEVFPHVYRYPVEEGANTLLLASRVKSSFRPPYTTVDLSKFAFTSVLRGSVGRRFIEGMWHDH